MSVKPQRSRITRPAKKAAPKTETSRWKLYVLMSLCSLIVVSGTFLAARQHFSSWDYSIRNSSLRKQIDELETEKRRLLLAREVALSPNEIKRAAKKLNIDQPEMAVVQTAKPVVPAKDREVPAAVASAKPTDKPAASYTMLTASVRMVAPKPPRPEREARRDQAE